MERPYTGLTASVKIGNPARTIAYVSGFDLNLDKSIIEILAFGHSYKEKVPAIKDWTASISGTVALMPGGTQAELVLAFESGELVTVGVFLDDNNYFEGTAYVAKVHFSSAPDGATTIDSDLSGSGAVLMTLAISDPPAPVIGATGGYTVATHLLTIPVTGTEEHITGITTTTDKTKSVLISGTATVSSVTLVDDNMVVTFAAALDAGTYKIRLGVGTLINTGDGTRFLASVVNNTLRDITWVVPE